MRFSRIAVTLAALLATGCTQEFVREQGYEPTDLGSPGGYVLLAAGYTDQVGEPFDAPSPLEPDWDDTVAINLRGGYQASPWISFEGAVTWEPDYGFEEDTVGIVQNGEADFLKAGPQVRISIPIDAPVAPYLLVGGGYAWVDGEADPIAGQRAELKEDGPYARAGIGIDGAIMEGWFWTVGGQYDVGFGDLDDVETWALMAGVGLKW